MVDGAIKAIEGGGKGSSVPTHAHRAHDSAQARNDRESEPAQAGDKRHSESDQVVAAALTPKLSTRVTLDCKTFQVYIQTVAEQPREPVIHSYPPPPDTVDPGRLIVLA